MKQFKKHIVILTAILFTISIAMAQTPQNRTTSTIVADVLAQLPAQNQPQYNQLMTDLVSTGEEGLLNLINRLNAPGNKSNVAVDYAISGWTNFVANDDAKRTIAATTYGKALSQSLDDEIRTTLIRQLELIGNNDNVPVLSSFLTNSRLVRPASQALVHINSEDADKVLAFALTSTTTDDMRISLANALVQIDYQQAEPTILNLLKNNPSGNLQKVIYDGLGKIGTKASLQTLKDAAQKSGYAYQKANSTSSYISLLNRLIKFDPALVKKEAEDLLKQATKLNKNDLKIAASQLLLIIPATNKTNLIKSVLKDGNASYLTNVLNAYAYQNNPKALSLILKELTPKATPDKQMAILYWLGNLKINSAVPNISSYLNSSNKNVQKAAINSLTKIGTQETILALAGLLKSNDETTVALAQQALENYNGDISYTLASLFNDASDAGKIAALQLIANRKLESQYNLVYNQMFQSNKTVKGEAAKTLQDVVTDKNLPDLFTLLEQTDTDYVSAIQQAINASLSNLPADEQLNIVSDRMSKSNNKNLYYSALANSESIKAMEEVINAYNTETGKNKQAALEALKQWKSLDGIYLLLDIARDSKDNNEIAQVVDAIVQKVTTSEKTGAVKYLFLRDAMEMAKSDQQKNQILRQLGNTNMYQAMLFVAPYMDQPSLSESAAQAAMNIAINNPPFAGAKTTEILNKVSKTLNNPDADYQRQSIVKYLNENPKDGGYVSMFNGKNLDGWKGLVENPIKRAQMTKKELATAQAKADKQMAMDWKVKDGQIIFEGKGFDNLCTEKQYGDFDMLVDWKLYPGSAPDAGIYLRGTPQVQIWETYRVKTDNYIGSGGLFNNKQNPSNPLKIADQKIREWNTFRIKMIGDRVSVWLNGELVTDNVILENYWDRNRPIFPIEQIELQAHGSKVAYRDILIKEIERSKPFKLSAEEEKEGYKMLFDGTNMFAWTGNTKDYVLEDCNIVMHPSQSFGGNLYTKDQFDNFIFRFEFMLTPGANNGLGIRNPMEGRTAHDGIELQILDNEAPVYKDLQVYQYHGSVYGVIPAKRGFLKPTGEWNYQEVVADGDNIKVILNGTVILDGNIREASKNGTIDNNEHPGLFNKTGYIGFLGHGSEVKFRNIRIKELK